jgi:hypothetical protein
VNRLAWCVALAIVAACGAKKPDAPHVELTDVGYALHLPSGMQHALDSIAPGFRPVQTSSYRADVAQAAAAGAGEMQSLFASVGDFDGDGTQDAVEEGTVPGDSALHVIAIMNGAKPVAIEVTTFPEYDADAVGIYLSRPTEGRTGAFEVVNYPDESMLYQYQDGGFVGTKIGG